MKNNLRELFKKTESTLNRHPYLAMGTVLVVAALLIISRRPEAIVDPQFWAEDGKTWYADAYNEGPFSSLLLTYGGYFVVIYRLIGSFSLLLPFQDVPLFFNVCALAFQLLPLVLINSGRLKELILYRSLALFISFLYIAVPNSAEVFLNLSNIQWPLGIAAFLVLVAKVSKKRAWKIFDVSILIITGLAGPLVILLLPLAGMLWFQAKSIYQRRRNLIILGILSFLQLLSIFFISKYKRVGAQPEADAVNFLKMMVGQIFSGTAFGEKGVDIFYASVFLLIFIFIIMAAVFLYVLKTAPLWLKLFQLYGLLVISSMLVSLRSVKEYDVWAGLTNPTGGQRYWYIPILVWITMLLWLCFNAKFKPLKYFSAFLLLSLVLVAIPRDWELRKYTDHRFKDYAQKFEAADRGSTVTIPINPDWRMKLEKK